MSFDWTLTQKDIDLTTQFMMLTNTKEYVCSDDFRLHRLHLQCTLAECVYPWHNPRHKRCNHNGTLCRHVNMQDPQHEIGAYFAKLKANKVIVAVGEDVSRIASNNKRKVDLFRWNWPRWREIVHGRLTEYIKEEEVMT